MRKIIFLYSFFLFWNCTPDKSFFDFDEVIHYSIKQEDVFLFKNSQNELEKKDFRRIYYGSYNYPLSIKEKDIVNKIEKFYSNKNNVSQNNIQQIDSLFTQRKYKNNEEYACEPLYNDIIIFKKNGKIVGLVKICFQCHKNYIVGSNQKTNCFGFNGEYETLKKKLQK